jgi:putative ABC transport system permease protein
VLDRALFRLSLALVAAVRFLAPESERHDWLCEWHGELWHRRQGKRSWGRSPRSGGALLFRALGAIPHALWLRAQEWRLEMLIQDLKFALRSHLRNPGLTAVAVLTLAIGVGAVTIVFGMVNSILLKPYPFADAERIYFVNNSDVDRPGARLPLSYPDFHDVREAATTLEAIAVYDWEPYNLRADDETLWVETGQVTAGFFTVLGAEPILGRFFTREDDRPGAEPTVVLSDGLWRSELGGDSAIVGRSIVLDGEPHTVIGIVPTEMGYPTGARIWVPLRGDPNRWSRHQHWLVALARLAPGVAPERARAELAAIGQRLQEEYPGSNEGRSLVLTELRQGLVGEVSSLFVILLGAVGFLLLIVCANVANLLLTRATGRQREMGVRSALGASRTRLARQLLTESATLAAAGCALGVGLAVVGTQGVLALLPVEVPTWIDMSLDWRVLAFAVAASAAAALLFGLAPALHGSRPDLNRSLKEGAGFASAGPGRGRLRSLLVVGELALSLTLLVGAGLMIRSFMRLSSVDPGFDTADRLVGTMQLTTERFDDLDQRRSFAVALVDRLESLPGVESVGLINRFPMLGSSNSVSFITEGQSPDAFQTNPSALLAATSPDYFSTMRIPLLRGRVFRDTDDADAPNVVVINHAMARGMWPDGDALGQRITWAYPPEYAEIVGVVGGVRHFSLDQRDGFQMYVPYAQMPSGRLSLVVAATGDPGGFVAVVRNGIRALEPNQALSEVQTLDEIVAESVWQWRFFTQLFWLFGGIAVILAAVGVYGVMSYTVSRRSREIGIRMALGAERQHVVWQVVRRAGLLILPGLALGILAALGLSRLLQSTLYEISALDPLTFVSVPVTLALIALLAAYVPARRASRVDAVEALRVE